MNSQEALHRVVIVGGGAGGLELATRLGDRYGKKKKMSVTLIDRDRTHIWKPKLHELAAGSMDMGLHEVDYFAQSHWHGFTYRSGEMIGLDRVNKQVLVAPYVDDDGLVVTPERRFAYDTLVISVGSQSNDFGTPGVAEYALKLETPADARRFHRRMLGACIRASTQAEPLAPHQLNIAIIGAGATGVELGAELLRTTREVVSYGMDRIDAEKDIKVTIIEAADRILPALPERLSTAAHKMLTKQGVIVHTNARVAELQPTAVKLADGRLIDAELCVWAAGVKAADFLRTLDGLEVNRINQLVVRPTLQTTVDENIFAFGDCAACPWPEANAGKGGLVPPRAQAAHQQATHIVGQIKRRLANQPYTDYRYRDFGSLVSLGHYSSVGSMMSSVMRGSWMIEGMFAKLMYVSLYKAHELALHGFTKMTLDTLARMITRRTEPHVKLH